MGFVLSVLENYDENYKSKFDENEEYKKHAKVWYILFLRLQLDTVKRNDEYYGLSIRKTEKIEKLKKEEEEFDKSGYGSFPSSAVLLFRRYFLDNVNIFNLLNKN